MRCIIRGLTTYTGPTLSDSANYTKVKDMVLRGLFDQTLHFYREELHPSYLHAHTSILPSVIKACASTQSLCFGLQIHCVALKSGSDSDPITSNSLLAMYAKGLDMGSARQMFDKMPQRDIISWNSMITCYIRNGYCFEAIESFKEMHEAGLEPKPELVASVLSICGQNGYSRLGRAIHARFIISGEVGVEESIFLSTALVDMYSKCLDLPMAFHVFDRMKERNEVSCTAMAAGCINSKNYDMSLQVFREMVLDGIKPNRVTLLLVLPACPELGALKHGKEIHGYAIRHELDSEPHLVAALIDTYLKCGSALLSAVLLFEKSEKRDVVMWSSMIRSFSQNGDSWGAMRLFHRMRMESIEPNYVTLLAIIGTCNALTSTDYGCGVHGYILRSGWGSSVFLCNSLIDMYAKYGYLDASHQIFREMPARDPVSWSALIQGYGNHGYGAEALQLFHEMQERKVTPDGITFLAVLSACNHAGLVEEGQKFFDQVMRDNVLALTAEHYICYIDLLGRAGKLEDACDILTQMPMEPSTRVWSSLVTSCKSYGRLDMAEVLAHQLINMEPENAANYTLLSMVYAEASNWVGVEEVRRTMQMRGVKKNSGFSRTRVENGSL